MPGEPQRKILTSQKCPYCSGTLTFLERFDEKIERYFCAACDQSVYFDRTTGAYYNYIPFHLL